MWDVKMQDVPVIKCVPFRGPLECFFILGDVFLECLNLFRKAMVLEHGVGFLIGNGCEESIHNGVKELSIDVRVCSKGRLGGSW